MHNTSQAYELKSILFPESYTDDDKESVLQAIAIAQQRAQSYNGDFTAPWLLSPFKSVEWLTRNQGREQFIDGRWENVIKVRWDVKLPNGASLFDSRYEHLLDINTKTAFLQRSGYLGKIVSVNHWKPAIKNRLLVTRWVVLHEDKYAPDQFGFKLLDQQGMNALFSSLAAGGWFEALQAPHRLMSKLYPLVLEEVCPPEVHANIYEINEKIKYKLTKWLADNDFYSVVNKGVNKGKKYLNRKVIGEFDLPPFTGPLAS